MRDEVSFFLILKQSLIFIHAQVQEQKLDLHKILGQRPFLPSEGYMNIWAFYFALKLDLHILKPVTTERAPNWIDALAVQSWDQCFESDTDAQDLSACQREELNFSGSGIQSHNHNWCGWWAPHADLKEKGQTMPCALLWHLLKNSKLLFLYLPESQSLFPWAQMGLGPAHCCWKRTLTTGFNPVSSTAKAPYHESCSVRLNYTSMPWIAAAPLANPNLLISL